MKLLTSQMHLEPSEGVNRFNLNCNKQDSIVISCAVQPNGARIKLIKTLLTSVCERNCYYCPFRSGRDFRRATFNPEEFARLFIQLHKASIADGIFLSSGLINGGIYTQDKLIATAEILRRKFRFNGYIHLKIMPGAQKDQVEQAMLLADRVSINLEAPNSERLHLLAPHKVFHNELLQQLEWINEIRQTKPGYFAWNKYWPSAVTQFVVGAVGDTDLELLSTTETLYRSLNLTRAYYSAFSPIQDTPLENHEPTSPLREHRLYEATFLLRDYGFSVEELEFDQSGNLPVHADPKLLWAQRNLNHPIEINSADQSQLLRIPGIGKKGASVIISNRRSNPITSLNQLSSMGINVTRIAPFILLNGSHPPHQLRLGL